MRPGSALTLFALAGLCLTAEVVSFAAVTAAGTTASPSGRIAFARHGPGTDETFTYTKSLRGSRVKPLYSRSPSGEPRWSPDGRRVAILSACRDGSENCAFTIVDAATGAIRQEKMRDPKLFTACTVWSPNGRRFACEGFGEPDRRKNGIYTLRSSDASGLLRLTKNPGGNDQPGDYSPQGTRLVFARFSRNEKPVGLFIVGTQGGEPRRITPLRMLVSSPGDWSPSGNRITFARRVSPNRHNSLWIVRADGSGLHEIRLTGAAPCGGSISQPGSRACIHPRWSPDGTRIVFGVVTTRDGRELENVYIANADGTGVTQVTRGGGDEAPDWGPAS